MHFRRTDGHTDGQTDVQTNGWTNHWTDRRKNPHIEILGCIYKNRYQQPTDGRTNQKILWFAKSLLKLC